MSKKKRRRSAAPETASAAAEAVPERPGVALAAILVLGVVLRCWHLDASLGGFHAHNEANYILIARHFRTSSLLNPISAGRHVYLETPPLYSYLLAAVFGIAGVSLVAARLVSVVSSLGLIVATFWLGKILFSRSAALSAALLVAVAPVSVLAGRNVQTDSMLLVFLVLGLACWARGQGRRDRLLAGLFFGLALFTKLFALVGGLGLALWETIRERGFSWLRDRSRWEAAAIAAALPAAFYGYHAAVDLSHVRREVAGGAAVATTMPQTASQWSAFGLEWFWAFSPLIALLVLFAVVRAAMRPTTARLFALSQLLVFFLFYLFVHKHSYYLLTLLPFAALLAGDFLESLGSRARTVGLAVTAVAAVFVSAIDLTSMKLGFDEFAELSRVAAGLPEPRIYLVDAAFRENAGIILALSDPQGRIGAVERVRTDSAGRVELPSGNVYLLRFVPPQTERPQVGWLFSRRRFGLTLFGWTLAEAHPNANFFRQGTYVATRTGGPLTFGATVLRTYPALLLLPLPPDAVLYRTPEGLSFEP